MATKRYRLTTRAQINGALREPGYVFTLEDGLLGPHRTVVASNHGASLGDSLAPTQDIPLYVEVDEELETERQEMIARHADEMAKLDGSADRNALRAKQTEESAEFGKRAAAKDLAARHAREDADLQERHSRETAAFEAAEEPPLPAPPAEETVEALNARHAREAADLAYKHETEVAAVEGRKPAPKDDPTYVGSAEDLERGREEMRRRHAAEMANTKGIPEREALRVRQAEELAGVGRTYLPAGSRPPGQSEPKPTLSRSFPDDRRPGM